MEARLPRRERERLRHRQEILEAARKVVAARGLEGLTVDLVAREAEFAVGSIYRHFRSKEELVEVLLTEFAEPMFEELEAMTGSGLPFREMLLHLVRTVHEQRVETLPLFKAYLAVPGNIPNPEGADGDRMRALVARYLGALDAVLVVGQAEGVLPAGDRGAMLVSLAGLMDAFTKFVCFHAATFPGDLPETVVGAFLNGFGAKR
jgi:AcrR family transcriptional regulator